MKPHDVSKLPIWAQELIASKEQTIADRERELENLKLAHAVLFDCDGWFTIVGPPKDALTPENIYQLFFLSASGAHPACSLKHGDVLLCGRRRQEPKGKEI